MVHIFPIPFAPNTPINNNNTLHTYSLVKIFPFAAVQEKKETLGQT